MNKFDFVSFNKLPKNMAPCYFVDFLLLLSGNKKMVRIIENDNIINLLVVWCKNTKYKYLVSFNNTLYISKKIRRCFNGEYLDKLTLPHEKSFGRALGYPKCCCKKISIIKEKYIDIYEDQLIDDYFKNEFKLINPKFYKKGYALISHIPCSYECKRSLAIAKKVFNICIRYKEYSPILSNIYSHFV